MAHFVLARAVHVKVLQKLKQRDGGIVDEAALSLGNYAWHIRISAFAGFFLLTFAQHAKLVDAAKCRRSALVVPAASALFLMLGLLCDTWLRFVIWLAVGLAIYFVYGTKHSGSAQPSARASR